MHRVGIQGGKGSYHELVALKRYHPEDIVYLDTFKELFEELKQGLIDSAICAVSNVHIGLITESNEELRLLSGTIKIVDRITIPVRHALLAVPGAKLADITSIRSQRPAIEQCKQSIQMYAPAAKVIEDIDTALSAYHVSQAQDIRCAVIASETAGRLYGLTPLLTDFHDDPDNATSFIEVELSDRSQL